MNEKLHSPAALRRRLLEALQNDNALHGENGVKKGGSTSPLTARSQNTSADHLKVEYKSLYEEHSKFVKILNILKGEYEESKRFEVFRRYTRLKGMIKRTIMYKKLDVVPDVNIALGVGSLAVMTATGLRKQIYVPECPRGELKERIQTLKMRITFIKGQIEQLEESYESSKQFMAIQRYRVMKSMIKLMLTNSIDLQHNQM